MDRLKDIYPYFRPLVGELLKLNAHREKNEDEMEKEVGLVRERLCEFLGKENLEKYFGKNMLYDILDKADSTAP